MPWEDDSPGIVDLVFFAGIAGGVIFFWKDILAFISGGGGLMGGGVYPRTGRSRRCSNHLQLIGCGGSNNVPSNRCDMDNVPYTAQEVTAQIQFGGGCSSSCGDEATIKHGGPGHQDGNCCWALTAVMQNGDVCFGGEGPHPDTEKCQQKLGNVGNLANKTVTIKSIFWKTASGFHQEAYVNGKHMGTRNGGQWGSRQTSNRIAATGGSQQIECRCDCSRAKWLWAEVAEIRPPFGAVTYPQIQSAAAKATSKGRRAVLSDMVDNSATEKPTLYEFQQDLAYFPPIEEPKLPVAESFLTQRWLGRK